MPPASPFRPEADPSAVVLESVGAPRRTSEGFCYLNLETATSFEVMNSSSAGSPRSVAAMPRLIAGMISAGSVMRSP